MRIFFFLTALLSNLFLVQGQDLKKLNKAELQARIIEMAIDYDSLIVLLNNKTIELKEAQEYLEQLKTDIGRSEEIVKQRENEILSIQNEFKQTETKNRQAAASLEAELRSVRDELKAQIAEKDMLAQQIALLKAENVLIIDSLHHKAEGAMTATPEALKLKQELPAEREIKKIASGTDFLNAYYQNPGNLDKMRFELRLSKIMVNENYFFNQNEGDSYSSNSSQLSRSDGLSYSYEYNDDLAAYHKSLQMEVGGTSETFGTESIQWYRQISMTVDGRSTALKVIPSSFAEIQANLPKISITKNKFVEIKYPGGEEEALLYNMKIEEVLSHGKKIIRWEIANEEVNLGSDGKSYTRDMIWRIYHIGNEAYVALSRPQLERLGLRFIPFAQSNPDYDQGISFKIYEKTQLLAKSEENFVEDWLKLASSNGKGYLIFLKPSPVRPKLALVNASAAVFLFKISPVVD